MNDHHELEKGKKSCVGGDGRAVFVDAVAGIAESEGPVGDVAVLVGLKDAGGDTVRTEEEEMA